MTLDQALQHAIAHHQAGRLADAEQLYRAILHAQPRHPDANHNLGLIAVQVGNPVAALPLLKTALEANPAQGQYWLSYADTLYQAGQSETARAVLAQGRARGLQGPAVDDLARRLTPNLTDPLAPALALREAGDYRQAQTWLRDHLAVQPQDAAAWAHLTQVLLLDRQVAAAANALQRALALAPQAAVVQRNQARLALAGQQPEAALAAAQQAHRTDPADPENQLVLAAALGATGHLVAAMTAVDTALQARPDYAEALAQRALFKARAGDLAGALADANQGLTLKPHLSALWGLLASLHQQRQDRPAAMTALERALAIEPDNVGYLSDLGELRRQCEDFASALALLARAVELGPDQVAPWVNYGAALQQAGRPEEAQQAYLRAQALDPHHAAILNNLGALAKEAERWEEALDWFAQAVALEPDNAGAVRNQAKALDKLERFAEARAVYRRALALEPEHVEVHIGLAALETATPDAPTLAILERAVAEGADCTTEQKLAAHFALGKLYAELDEPDRAFPHYARGHAYRARKHGPHDHRRDQQHLTFNRQVFTAAFFAERGDWGLPVLGPIFIVGMPRSGTSLIEQILATHSRVHGAGERLDINDFANDLLGGTALDAPQAAAGRLSAPTIRAMAERHWECLRTVANGRSFVTDKAPHNFQALWLIALLYPRAIILHSVRNPIDTCLSCFFQNFVTEHAYTDDLRALGQHYNYYRAMMAHWESVLPVPIHPVVYEDLVADPETRIPQLLACCGLEYEPACLEFHRTERAVKTASAHQVKRPMYRTSVEKWRRYERHLEPLLEELEQGWVE